MASGNITLDFDNIMRDVRREIQEVLHDNTDQFKKCVSDQVHQSVYPAYTPKAYTRREDGGGLSDPNNYEVFESDLSLTLLNTTISGPDYWKYSYPTFITEIVEDGSGDGWQGVPARPFMEKALNKFAYDILEPEIDKRVGGGK